MFVLLILNGGRIYVVSHPVFDQHPKIYIYRWNITYCVNTQSKYDMISLDMQKPYNQWLYK